MKTFAEILADRLEENGKVRDMGRPPVEDTERMAAKELRAMQSRIEALENEMQEQARIIGMGAERELALIAKAESMEKDAARLHGEIMNIQPKPPAYGVEMLLAYKVGHRDARHAAAELVAAMQKD